MSVEVGVRVTGGHCAGSGVVVGVGVCLMVSVRMGARGKVRPRLIIVSLLCFLPH